MTNKYKGQLLKLPFILVNNALLLNDFNGLTSLRGVHF